MSSRSKMSLLVCTVLIVLFFGIVVPSSALGELTTTVKQTAPDWWKAFGFEGKNPELNDGEDPDNLPDHWTSAGYVKPYYDTPGMYILGHGPEAGKPRGTEGSLAQEVGNRESLKHIKEVAVKIIARGLGDKSSALIVSVRGDDPRPNKGDFFRKRGVHFEPEVDATKYVVFRLPCQPAKEKVKVKNVETGINEDVEVYPVVVDEIAIRTRCINPACGNPRNGKALAGGLLRTSTVTYDPNSQVLSFSDSMIDTLNLNGSNVMDTAFASDPILGATISIGDFTLVEQRDDGWFFEGGTYEIRKGEDVFLRTEIPWLWVNDDDRVKFGENVFGEFDDLLVDLDLGSSWLQAYVDDYEHSPYWAEFRANTFEDVESWFSLPSGSNNSCITSATVMTAYCVPVPPAVNLGLVLLGVCGLGRYIRRRRLA